MLFTKEIKVTGKTNPGVKRTGNFYNHINMKERKKKLERILQ